MTASFPAGSDREAARRWLRDRNPAALTEPPPTHDGLLHDQRNRLLRQFGLPDAQRPASPTTLDIILDGPAVSDHSASISMLGSLYTSLQNTVTAVAQALEGTPTVAGQVAGYITAATQLRSVATFPSSYGLHLQGPDTSTSGGEQRNVALPPNEESALLDRSAPELLPEAIGVLLDIADLAQVPESSWSHEPLMERLVPLGQRALAHLALLAGTLAAHNASLKIIWQPDTAKARTSSLSTDVAARLKGLSEGVQFTEADSRHIEGELIEANLRRGSVVIELDSGSKISARTEASVAPRLRENLLGKRVSADVHVTIAKYAGGRQRENFLITDIFRVDD